MDKAYLEDLLSKGLSQRKMASAARCSQVNVRYWLRKHGLSSPKRMPRQSEVSDEVARDAPTLLCPPTYAVDATGAPKRNTNRIAAVTESRVLAALTAAGFPCYVPFGVGKSDLVIETADGLKTVQCKTASLVDGRKLWFRSCSTLRDGSSASYRGIVDFFAVSCPGVPGVFLVPVDEVGVAQVFLRLSACRSGQVRRTRYAADYLVPGSDVP